MICYHVRKFKNDVYRYWLVAKHSWMVVIAESYQLLNEHQWNNYLQIILDYALSDTPIYKFGKNGAKKQERHLNIGIEKINKLFALEKKYIMEPNFKHI